MLPCLRGYDGPHALHDFLAQHLRLPQQQTQVLYDECNTAQTNSKGGDGDSNELPFAVFVYVAHTAPPAPTHSHTTTSASSRHRRHLSLRDIVAQQQQQQQQQQRRSSTKAVRFTDYVLQHDLWDRLSFTLSEECLAFLLSYCVVAVQFAERAGALQVLGPSVRQWAARGALCTRSAHRKRAASRSLSARPSKRPCNEDRKDICTRERQEGALALPPLSRVRLDQAVLLRNTEDVCTSCGDNGGGAWLPGCQTASQEEAASEAMAEWWAHTRHQQRRERRTNTTHTLSPIIGTEVSDALLEAVFPYTLQHSSTTSRDDCVTRTHLRHVLQCLLSQCAALDVRGMALKHIHFIEARAQHIHSYRASHDQDTCKEEHAGQHDAVRRLIAPLDIVLAFLHTVLFGLRYTPSPASASSSAPRDSAVPFWGSTADVAAATWQALARLWRRWLSVRSTATNPSACTNTYSKHKECTSDAVCLGECLCGVKVAQVPWLRGFFTTHEYTDATRQHARRRRSGLQQSVFMQVVCFVSQQMVPRWLHAVFHITWNVKATQQLVYIPHTVWRRLVRRTLRQLRSRRGHADTELVCTQQQQQEQQRDCGGVSGVTSRRYLYAAMRFLPDSHKLRPVACVRLGSAHFLRRVCSRRRNVQACSTNLSAPLSPRTPSYTNNGSAADARNVLRVALLCLSYEVQAHYYHNNSKKGNSNAAQQLLNGSHQTEYAQLRRFAELSRAHTTEGDNTNETRISAPVSFVRADAVRCYDALSQRAVWEAVEAVVREEWYCELHFTALYGTHRTPSEPCTLRRDKWSCVLAWSAVQGGVLPNIPPCCLLIEDTTISGELYGVHDEKQPGTSSNTYTSKTRKRASNAHDILHALYGNRTQPTAPSAVTVGVAIRGEAIRAVLRDHLVHHLVLHRAQPRLLYRQHCGIVQGSPVAMLLCNVVLGTIDEAVHRLLVEHGDAHGLLLRRVDDILIGTRSLAAQHGCLQRMQRGWPELGYRCQRQKLQHCTASGQVAWCGLLLHTNCHGVEVSVEWGRAQAGLRLLTRRLTTAAAAAAASHYDSNGCVSVQRCETAAVMLMRRIALRVPLTALCARTNRVRRVVQTLYEMSLLWCRLWLRYVDGVVIYSTGSTHVECEHAAKRQITLWLQRPLRAAMGQLWAHVQRQHRRLQRVQSSCAMACYDALRLCMTWAMHQTLQAQLRSRRLRARWRACIAKDKASRLQTKGLPAKRVRSAKERDRGQLWWRLARNAAYAATRLMRRGHTCHEACDVMAALLLTGEKAEGADSVGAQAVAALRL